MFELVIAWKIFTPTGSLVLFVIDQEHPVFFFPQSDWSEDPNMFGRLLCKHAVYLGLLNVQYWHSQAWVHFVT